ncbi:MAG: TetR/AcrR family transcriptional regulator C-terminal domain-containing protein [Anaerorhabdus sp.]|uniref:TetR/AcrR family transcriptional regulator C-terminal domain-containing protein n=2 Tax=Anaerorhabdus sp. TaxID=1872524 RepID=UPI002FC8445E
MQTIKFELANSIKTLMKTSPLDKITVTDIVKEAHCTRQTFYRHFVDKYDLVNWYFEELVMQSFKEMGLSKTLYEGLVKKFNFIEQEYNFFYEAFSSNDANSLVQYDYETILDFYTKIIEKKTHIPLDNQTTFLLKMYCRGSIDMTVDWVKNGMKLPPKEIAALLIQALPEPLKEDLSILKLK